MFDVNMLEDLIESLKLESDWERGKVPSVDCLYTTYKDNLRFIVSKMSYENNYRLHIIGIMGKTQIFGGEPIKKLYETLAERFGTDESAENIGKSREDMLKRALERLKEK